MRVLLQGCGEGVIGVSWAVSVGISWVRLVIAGLVVGVTVTVFLWSIVVCDSWVCPVILGCVIGIASGILLLYSGILLFYTLGIGSEFLGWHGMAWHGMA